MGEQQAPSALPPLPPLPAGAGFLSEDGDLPEEPAPVGVPSLSVEAAPVASEPDKERALADELLFQQVASPQKAMIVPEGLREDLEQEGVAEMPQYASPLSASFEAVWGEEEADQPAANSALAGARESSNLASDELPFSPPRGPPDASAPNAPQGLPPWMPLPPMSPTKMKPMAMPMAPRQEWTVNAVALQDLPLAARPIGGACGDDVPKQPLVMAVQEDHASDVPDDACFKCLTSYSGKVVRHPCKFICLYFILMVAVIVACWRPFEVDTDFESFIRADGNAMRRREAYLLALAEKKGIDGQRRLGAKTIEDQAPRGPDGQKAPFADEEWWRAMRKYEDEETLEDERRDEENGEVQLDEKLLEESEDIDSSLPYSDAREDGEGRRLQGKTVFFIKKSFVVIYKSAKDALDGRVLRDVRNLEQRLRKLSGWDRYCRQLVTIQSRNLCDPGESLASWAWPTQEPAEADYQFFKMKFDSDGKTMLAQPALLSYLQTSGLENHAMGRFFPKTFFPPPMIGNASYAPPEAIRTVFTFKITVGGSGDSMPKVKKAMAKIKEGYKIFCQEEVYPILRGGSGGTNVYYYGDHISGFEINLTLFEDAKYALGSVLFVLCYIFFHTRSLLLSVSCLGIIFASVPVAYVLTPASKTTIASFLSLFLITGVGSDVVFVFTDFWDQSNKLKSSMDVRIAWMLLHAGKSCFATSLTTSVSFFANLASVLQPLREFGLFMGLCVMCAFILVLLFLPPILVLKDGKKAKKIAHFDPADEEQRFETQGPPGAFFGSGRQLADEEMPDVGSMPVGYRKDSREYQQDTQKKQSFTHCVLLFILGFVINRPGKILVFTGALVLVFIIGVAAKAELATGVPKIFPPGHNQVQAEEWQGKFSTVPIPKVASAGALGAACAANITARTVPKIPCIFHWCEAPPSRWDSNFEEIVGAADATSGYCWRSPVEVTQVSGANYTDPASRILKDPYSTEGCSMVYVRTRMASPKMPQKFDWADVYKPAVEAMLNKTLFPFGNEVRWLERLALENWETGQITMSNFFDMGVMSEKLNNDMNDPKKTGRQCEIQTLCFFGAPKCHLPNWRPTGKISLTVPPQDPPKRRLMEEQDPFLQESRALVAPNSEAAISERRLMTGQLGRYTGPLISANKRVDVTMLFGLRAAGFTPLVGAPAEHWSFDPSFEPENPWAQRAIFRACLDVPADLKVISTDCWVNLWKTWLTKSGERFPSRNFDAKVAQWFVTGTGVIQAPSNLWMVNRRVKASKISFVVNVRSDASAAEGIEYLEKWDKYMDFLNEGASITANRAWYTAALFVRSEAEVAIIDSTVETIIIAAVSGWFGMLAFTKDPWTSGLVTSLVLGIISGLAFFMVVVMGWQIGPIEVISLVVFVGYSVTYSLHIAHNYVEVPSTDKVLIQMELEYQEKKRAKAARKLGGGFGAVALGATAPVQDPNDVVFTASEIRRARTRMSVLHVGGATLSSAVSTLGSSMFLLFCTLNIFVKLGSVVIAVTLLSIVFALVPLPAMLMVVGPGDEPGCTRLARCCCAGRRRDGPPASSMAPEDPQQPLVSVISPRGERSPVMRGWDWKAENLQNPTMPLVSAGEAPPPPPRDDQLCF